MRLGVLDIGSNTVHLLIVDARPGGAPAPAASHKWELKLSERLDNDNRIGADVVARLIDVVGQSQRRAEDAGCREVLAFATSAIREAANGEAVLAEIRQATGQALEVMTGRDEARVTFLAVRRWFGWSAGRLAVFDIGGGSLEMAGGSDEDPAVALSVPLGAGRLTREYGEDLRAMRRSARAQIGAVIGELTRAGPFHRAVGTSKTFRSLGRITGTAPSSDGPFVSRVLTREALAQWLPRLAELSPAERAELPGVSAARAEQLLAGAIVADAVLELAGIDRLALCPWALREGVLLRHIDRLSGEAS